MDSLAFERRGPVGILKLNRPSSLNALNRAILKEMDRLLNEEVIGRMRVLILTGAGDRAFGAGADVKEMLPMSPLEMQEFCALGQRVSRLLENGPFVSIAAVNGYALGGGMELALACDFIYAGTHAKFGLPEVGLGLIPGFGGTQRLSRAVGTRMAKELIFSGRTISVEEAFRLGIINKICKPDELLGECEEIAKAIGRNASAAVLQAKKAIEHGSHLAMEDALELEKTMCALVFGTPDRLEGMTAFVEKREPVFA